MEIFDESGSPVVCSASGTNDWTVLRSEAGYGTSLRCDAQGRCRDGNSVVRFFWHTLEGGRLRRHRGEEAQVPPVGPG